MDWILLSVLKLLFINGILSNPLSISDRYISLSEFNNETYKHDIMRLAKVAEIRNFMDESVDPCKDFYQFSCGSWSKINEARTEATTGFFEKLSNGFSLKVAKVLNETNNPKDTEIDKAIKRFYKSCMKTSELTPKERRLELNTKIIKQYGEMPALVGDNWNEKNFDWLETIARIHHDFYIQIIIGADIMGDFKNNTINRIYVGQAELLLDSKSMYKEEANKKYRKLYINKMAEDMRKNLELSNEIAEQTAKEIVDFEIALADGLIDDHKSLNLNQSTVLTNAYEMTERYGPTIDMRKYLKISFGEDITEQFYEFHPQFQKNVKTVIENTPKRMLANYIFFKLAARFFSKIGKGRDEQHELCQNSAVTKYFSRNLDNIIYRRYNTKDTERDVNIIWREVKDAFRRDLYSEKLSWIKRETRETAVKKLDAMKLEINSYLDTNFTEEYGDLQLDNTNYVSNLKNIYQHMAKKKLSELKKPPKPFEAGEELSYTPANVILENKIKIPVSLLQPNYLWGESYPIALKFGTLGYLIGHELMHGFDDAGRDYDENGNQRDWWDENSKLEFDKRTECFKEQYHQYIFGGNHLPLSEAQSENIADNGGLQIAYQAYLKWLEEGNDISYETFPGMKYTNKQLFFISFAQIWCSDTHPSLRGFQMATDEHTPGIYRVIGVLSNFPEFAKEFKCAADSDMVPSTRCEIY